MDQPAKTKVYEAPKLVRYGDLVEVTWAMDAKHGNDNPVGGKGLKTG